MKKSFVYGVSVEGTNFTDRVIETRRLKMDFENGQNVILMSPRRMGKTSLVKRAMEQVDSSIVKVVYMDIYECRSEKDFYQTFAKEILRATATKTDQILENAKQFLSSLIPKLSFSPMQDTEFSMSLSLDIQPETDPHDILNLPEQIAKKLGVHIVVCIDEFQQIGEFTDSITVQKRLRAVWQHQRNVSYCLFGSKKHMLIELFHDKQKPFYQFGDTIYLDPIPTEDWVPFICQKFAEKKVKITEVQATRICNLVDNYSSYVQQLAWNVLIFSDEEVTESSINEGLKETVKQNIPFYMEQIKDLSTFQLNYLRAICSNVNSGFTSKDIIEKYSLGSKSNVSRLHTSLIDKELIETRNGKDYILDPVFAIWFKNPRE